MLHRYTRGTDDVGDEAARRLTFLQLACRGPTLPITLRVTTRFSVEPDFEDRTIGFRCAADIGK